MGVNSVMGESGSGSVMGGSTSQGAMDNRIIVALDMNKDDALILARQLEESAIWMKVGMTLFYKEGPSIVSELKALGFKVFCDLKLYDIPNQVKGAARSLTELGVDMFTVHASGGKKMMQAAIYGVNEALDADSSLSIIPKVLGVTVLTSMDNETLSEIGCADEAEAQVIRLAKLAKKAGLDGLVCSAAEALQVRATLGENFEIVTPGIRLCDGTTDDQKRVTTPKVAFANGANYIVVGRPITQASNPISAFKLFGK